MEILQYSNGSKNYPQLLDFLSAWGRIFREAYTMNNQRDDLKAFYEASTDAYLAIEGKPSKFFVGNTEGLRTTLANLADYHTSERARVDGVHPMHMRDRAMYVRDILQIVKEKEAKQILNIDKKGQVSLF